jgi:hypothetical protein
MAYERDPGTGTSEPIAHRPGAIWTERLLVALILTSLAATSYLLLAIQRHAATKPAVQELASTISQKPHSMLASESTQTPTSSPKALTPPKPPISQRPAYPPEPQPDPVDPTKQALARLTTATTIEVEAGQQADRRAIALEAAREAAEADSRRWKRRELLVRQQIASLTDRAERLELAASTLDAERDVLARERDALKAALTKAIRRSGYAVLPYKGANGTWRRPIVIECTAGGVKLQPQGLSFSSLELSPLINPRSSPLVRAVARAMLHVQTAETPDGAPAVPYLVFLVRPNGIRPYYEARSCLEPLGIAFGYELIQQDMVVDIPDFDNLATWDGTVPLDMPLEPAPRPKTDVAMITPPDRGNAASPGSLSGSPGNPPSTGRWPQSSNLVGNQSGDERGGTGDSTPDDFVWPNRGSQNPASGGSGTGSNVLGRNRGMSDGNGQSVSSRPHGAQGFGSVLSDEASAPDGTHNPAGSNARSNTAANSFGTGRLSERSAAPSFDSDHGSTLSPSGGLPSSRGNLSALGQSADISNRGNGLAAGGVLDSLPDLEPAGDGVGSTQLPHGAGPPTGGGSPGRFGAGGGLQRSGTPQPAGRIPAGAGSGSDDVDAGGGGQPGVAGTGLAGGMSSSTRNPATSTANSGGTGADQQGQGAGIDGMSPSATKADSEVAGSQSSNQVEPGNPIGLLEKAQGSGLSSGDVEQRSSDTAGTELPADSGASKSTSSASTDLAKWPGSPSSSSTPSSSNSATVGLPFGASSSSSSSSSVGSSASFAPDTNSAREPSDDWVFGPPPRPTPPPGSIEVPFEIVVVCRQNDLLLHPGGYRLTTKLMQEQGASKDSLLAREILAMVRKRAIVDPLIRPQPRIKFLVESEGSETFWAARRQLLFALPDWPMALQVSGSHDSHVFTKETW